MPTWMRIYRVLIRRSPFSVIDKKDLKCRFDNLKLLLDKVLLGFFFFLAKILPEISSFFLSLPFLNNMVFFINNFKCEYFFWHYFLAKQIISPSISREWYRLSRKEVKVMSSDIKKKVWSQVRSKWEKCTQKNKGKHEKICSH